MKLNRKVFWVIVLILVISIVWVAIYTIKQKNEDYEAKIYVKCYKVIKR